MRCSIVVSAILLLVRPPLIECSGEACNGDNVLCMSITSNEAGFLKMDCGFSDNEEDQLADKQWEVIANFTGQPYPYQKSGATTNLDWGAIHGDVPRTATVICRVITSNYNPSWQEVQRTVDENSLNWN